MAAAQKNYIAKFILGAQLAGSFKGVMQAAQSRLRSLESASRRVGASIGKMTAALGGLGALVGLVGVGKMFSSLFEGASEAADDFLDRQRKLTVSLLKNDEIRKGGMAKAKQQTDLIYKANEALSKQGVVSKELLDISAASLANAGVPPKYIVEASSGMADLLVAAKGVNATQADMAKFSKVYGIAIRTGMTRGLREYGIILSDNQAKEFKDMKQYSDFALRRYNYLKKLGAFAAGTNMRELKSDQGRIHKLHTDMDEMRIRLGLATLPARAQMADAWRGALHQLEPMFTRVGIAAADMATWVGREMGDMTKALSTPQAMKTWSKLAGSFKAIGAAWTGMQVKGKKDETLGTMFGNWMQKQLDDFAEDNIRLAIGITNLKAEVKKMWADFYGGLLVIKPYWDSIYNTTAEWLKLLSDDSIHAAMKKMGDDIKEFIHDPIGAIINRWKEFKGWVTGSTDAFSGGGGTFGKVPGGSVQGGADTQAWASPQAAAKQAQAAIEAAAAVQPSDLTKEQQKGSVLYEKLLAGFKANPPQGLPPDAAGFGISKGTPEEWARFGVSVAHAESSFNPRSTNLSDPGGSFGVFQYAHSQAGGNAYDVDKSVAAFVRDADEASKDMRGLHGSILGQRFSTIGRHPSRGAAYLGGAETIAKANAPAIEAAQNAPPPLLAAIPGMARGGIISRMTHAMIGERGPEAVIPLSGGRRAEGLLGYASRALGIGASHSTSVNFTPNITIHGGATAEAQESLDKRLRDLARDFVSDFKRAQRHERRLSYEGGYS